jgi:hypothetical protein
MAPRSTPCLGFVLVLAACGGGSDAPPTPPACAPQHVTVALLGNSIMAGIGDDPTLRAMLAQRFGGDVIVVNRAIGGTELGDIVVGRAGFHAWPADAGDVTVILDGTNEARRGTPLETFRADLAMVAQRDRVVLVTPPPMDATQPLSNGADTSPYAASVRAAGATADAYAYTLAQPEWQTLLADGVHPTPAFAAQLAREVVGPAVVRAVAPLRCQ